MSNFPYNFHDDDNPLSLSSMNSTDQKLDFSLVLASSVHDMKNSLGMLLNSLEVVIEDSVEKQDDTQKQHFSILQYEASRINSELIQLLTIYRLQDKNLPLNIDENYIYETFEDQLARNDMLFKTKGIDVAIECDQDLVWFYDNELLGNVIHNVLINAARYAKENIILSASIVDQELKVSIADDGNGFPAFMLEAEPLNEDVKKSSNSTHLGLFFAAKIASFHKKESSEGRINLSNEGPLKGGAFSIFIP